MNKEDACLISRLKKKDQSALEAIIEKYNKYVASIVCKILYGTGSQADIQGVINHVFFLLWANAGSIDTEKDSELKSYIGTMARNMAINEKKRHVREQVSLDDHMAGEISDDFDQVELREVILSALKQLNQEDQMILLKFYFQGRSIQEIAGEMGKPESTVKSRLKRSREKLKKFLEEGGFIYES